MVSRHPDVTPNEFFALDLRVGRITAVDAFPEARKPAWKLTVDFGPEIGTLRTSAQVTTYAREELLGRTVVGAINLGTRQIGPFMSEFLVLGAIHPDDGAVHLLELPAAVEPGWSIA
jgi:tRNA-binding protein